MAKRGESVIIVSARMARRRNDIDENVVSRLSQHRRGANGMALMAHRRNGVAKSAARGLA